MSKDLYFIEVTDCYGGEANYSWVTRHVIRASSRLGAVNRFSRLSGLSWHKVEDYGDMARYDSASGATCFFIEPFDADAHTGFNLFTDDRL